MPDFCKRPLALWGFAFLVLLGGCSAKPECDSFETRNAVLQIVSNDHTNALATFAAKNATTNNDGAASAGSKISTPSNSKDEKPLYLLGERIVTTSTSQDKLTLKCSGSISATVGDTKASKEIEFTVQKTPSGELSVSVVPFQF